MGPEGAANIIFKREIDSAPDPEAERQKKIAEYKTLFSNPYKAAGSGYLDDVINPKEMRSRIIKSLLVYESKKQDFPRKKHGNIPL